jgi:hypothetical protein
VKGYPSRLYPASASRCSYLLGDVWLVEIEIEEIPVQILYGELPQSPGFSFQSTMFAPDDISS